MHFHLVCSPEFFVVAFSRKSTRKTFRRSCERMLLKDHEFARNPTSPPYVLLKRYPEPHGQVTAYNRSPVH